MRDLCFILIFLEIGSLVLIYSVELYHFIYKAIEIASDILIDVIVFQTMAYKSLNAVIKETLIANFNLRNPTSLYTTHHLEDRN